MVYVARVVGRGTGVYHAAHGADASLPVLVDGDPAFGGAGRAPGPFEHLLGSLSACCQITAEIVAGSRGWSLRGFRSTTEARFDNRVLVRGRPGTSHFESVDIGVEIDADLTAEQVRELEAEVERRCPIR
ncbi:OsmC family protein [Mycolicibacterium goodii]|uniref:OsmC family protein n=1 Tax=Mycolicibacterium goodii TaxID=134601 RepID=UPI001BDCCCAC|nr:OsmC family protein [Mycolicibacterium goodii]MBU8816803.1 OsmC family protein [Mycolicibacterium goodii]MBU8828286.1 OsmC family protein [Mycolicibacterium goodii]